MYSSHYMKIIKEVESGKTCNEICDSLNISRKQLYYYMQCLKNDGIDFNRKYYSNGTLKYEPRNKIVEVNPIPNLVNLITPIGSTIESFMVISDTHFGNEKERIDLLNRAYEYAIKHNIHVIFIAGDLLDGNYTLNVKERSLKEVIQQINHFIKDYPYDKNIINIAVLGDHDSSVYNYHYINLKEVINNKRHDIAVGGFNNVMVGIKNDYILLYHHVGGGAIPPHYSPIILKGHSHYYGFVNKDDNTLDISVPSLSDIKSECPSALVIDTEFKDGYIVEANVKQVLFLEKDCIVSSIKHVFNRNDYTKSTSIKNEERIVKEQIGNVEEDPGIAKQKKKGELNVRGNC